ncbi:hypothetical protein CLOSTHATH_03729 [Hungatella hathewayi DSM 13479]|uniref:Uncharacterized protein n=1 Tax=Hungatella hathewayi DSM 13479 TaxID=566550 RepID=D3AJD8_9FIRM|nr:hypothetical protein CLOSTHATH_03729 [Hungatella hathewayi DSM 13479]
MKISCLRKSLRYREMTRGAEGFYSSRLIPSKTERGASIPCFKRSRRNFP